MRLSHVGKWRFPGRTLSTLSALKALATHEFSKRQCLESRLKAVLVAFSNKVKTKGPKFLKENKSGLTAFSQDKGSL